MTVGALGKRHQRHIDLGLLQVEHVRDFKAEVLDVCKAQRLPPLTPQRFNEELRQKVFTNQADHASVEKLYAATFNDVLNFATVYIWSSRMERCAVPSVAEILPYCSRLEELWLEYNKGSLTTRCQRLSHSFRLLCAFASGPSVTLPAELRLRSIFDL